MGSLRSFIRAVRSSKTIADERAAIRKQSAKVRTAFRDPHLDVVHLRKNIQKLLYLYILGEPTAFGQVACLRLLSSTSFVDKRLGYLAAMLILDENQEILTLLTNSLDIDIKSGNQYIAGLALCTLGNIASPELAKDLYADVDSALTTGSSYVQKKAAITAAKLVRKDPDLSELFIERIDPLLKAKSHGVLLGALQLAREIYLRDESSRDILRKDVPKIMAHLKFLASTGYSPEYDVRGVPDPFLYCSLMHTLRLFLQDEPGNANMEILNDLLAQICTKLENSKGAGRAVLYEAVQTTFALDTDSSLRVLGVNILSKFLSLRDNNTRYVALNTLINVMNFEPVAVQRHRKIIISCLQDGDISIRRRALELTFTIMNEQNIRMLTKELLKFLAGINNNDDDELKLYITTQLTLSCYKYSSEMEWTFNTLIKMLQIAGNFFSDDILSSVLALVMQNNDQNLTNKVLVHLISASSSSAEAATQFGLALVTIWCLGEYGDLVKGMEIKSGSKITETSEVDLLESFLNLSSLDDKEKSNQLRLYALTAALKLSAKFSEGREIERLRKFIVSCQDDSNLEIQIRAIEYTEIFGQPSGIKNGILERMPPPPKKQHEGFALFNNADKPVARKPKKEEESGNALLDLLDDEEPAEQAKNTAEKKENTLDILSDIFGDQPSSAPSAEKSVATKTTAAADIMDLFDTPKPQQTEVSPSVAKPPPPPSGISGYDDGSIEVDFVSKSIGSGKADLDIVVKNKTSSSTITGITILCATTKHQKLQLSAMDHTTLKPNEYGVLKAEITGKQGSKVKMRVRLSYSIGGDKIQQQFDFAGMKDRL